MRDSNTIYKLKCLQNRDNLSLKIKERELKARIFENKVQSERNEEIIEKATTAIEFQNHFL